ncbi:LPS-assembly protein LptD [Anaeromyxobacter oryzisoli]|uniref:LPS-assembly protein LptD n=1 Tax=Anaeromyxobacter oryzisoli TaxID=2925408 RepID=UPI001F5935AA|nr:LPS-assembly protein LptD [Anaeromyxobacter sp. SG63]
MNVLAVLALAGLVAGPASPSPGALPGGTGEVSVQADRITREPDGRVHLEGHAMLRRGVVTLRARSARIDPETGEIDAVGDVLLTDATRVVSADGLHAVLGGAFEAEHVVSFVKDRPVELGEATTVEGARRIGSNRLAFTGGRLEGDKSGRLQLTETRLTLCDCGGGAPSWEIRAGKADVIPGKRAILSWPVIYVTPRFLLVQKPVPVLVVPWLYLPLGDRQTGLLVPTIGSTTNTGFDVAQPLFVTLGQSADLTLTPEYFFGPGAARSKEKPSVRGPGARLELRWAPAEGDAGRLELTWLHDLDREAGGAHGDRLGISGADQQGLGPNTRLRLDLGLSSDPVLWRDFTTDVLLKQAFYSRSDVLLSHRGDALVLEGNAAYYQPLTPNKWTHEIPAAIPGALAPSGYGVFGSDVPVFHRWPGVAGTLLPSSLGPVSVSGRVGVQRFAPASGDASSIALGPGDPGGRKDHDLPVVYAIPREAATRLDSRLELRAPFTAGPVAVEPYVRGAALGYQFDTSRDAAAVAWAVGGAVVETELSRRYGELLHRITPRLELRVGTGAAGPGGRALDLPAYDAWDRVVAHGPILDATGRLLPSARSLSAAPDGRFQQVRASVESRLSVKGVDRLRLELGQDVDAGGGRLGETFFSADAHAGPVAGDLSGRILVFQGRTNPSPEPSHSSPLDPFTELRAGVSLGDPHRSVLRAGLLAVGSGGSGTLDSGVDPLFDLRPAPIDAVAQGSFGARMVVGGATLGYDALVPARTIDVGQCSGGTAQRRIGAMHVQQHAASFTWDSPCHCFLARLIVAVDDCATTTFKASLDLSRLGERAKFP